MRALPQLAEREEAELRDELLLLSEELTELREELPLMRLLLCEEPREDALLPTETAEEPPPPPELEYWVLLCTWPPEEPPPSPEDCAELLLLGQAEQSRHRPSGCSCPLLQYHCRFPGL